MSITSIVYETVRKPLIYLGLGITALAAVACSSSGETVTTIPEPTRARAEVASATPKTLDETVVVLTPETNPRPEPIAAGSPEPEPLEATVAAEVATAEATPPSQDPTSTVKADPTIIEYPTSTTQADPTKVIPGPTSTEQADPTQPPATPTSTSTPVPLPDLQIPKGSIDTIFLQVNDDGTSSYKIEVNGTYGNTKPKVFNIGVSGLDGIIDSSQQVTTINSNGTFNLTLSDVRLPPGNYPISFFADNGGNIKEIDENNNGSTEFTLNVVEPLTFTNKEWEYLQEIAFTTESGRKIKLFKYEVPIRVYVSGNPLPEHRDRVDYTVKLLHDNGWDIETVDNETDANLFYPINVDHAEFYDIFPNANREFLDSNGGIFFPNVLEGNSITKGTAAVARNSIAGWDYSQEFILHIISEELIQLTTGLFNDSPRYPGSIFYDDPNDKPLKLLPIDIILIQFMSKDLIKAGMGVDEVRRYIRVIG